MQICSTFGHSKFHCFQSQIQYKIFQKNEWTLLTKYLPQKQQKKSMHKLNVWNFRKITLNEHHFTSITFIYKDIKRLFCKSKEGGRKVWNKTLFKLCNFHFWLSTIYKRSCRSDSSSNILLNELSSVITTSKLCVKFLNFL